MFFQYFARELVKVGLYHAKTSSYVRNLEIPCSQPTPETSHGALDKIPDMLKQPRPVGGFVALPVELPVSEHLWQPSKHYFYLKPHDPQIPDADAPRCLFVTNIPVTTMEVHLKHLFSQQLSAGTVERVEFSERLQQPLKKPESQSGRKRKRATGEEVQFELGAHRLPDVWQRSLHASGAQAVVVFVDILSMETSLRAAKKAAKIGTRLVWGKDIEYRIPPLGLQRYKEHNNQQFPPRKELLQSVNAYMSAYSRMEEIRTRAYAKKRQEPDEEGFVTVTKGARGLVRKEDAKELRVKQKDKNKGLEDFYRFQMRERRKEGQGEFLRKFEEDKKRVAEMKQRRGRLRVSPNLVSVVETNMFQPE